jgi:asparagine synthase (glutamine-hydrolysing)
LFDAVQHCLTDDPDVWSQLSGGMDSSSVVAAATALARAGTTRHGVTGAVTYGTTPPVGADLAHAALVSRDCGVPQHVMTEWWGWQDDDRGPPLFDQPSGHAATYALTRRVTRVVRAAGGRVLLSGLGADLYLRPHFDEAADDIAQGHVLRGFRALTQWASAMRTSFWPFAFAHGVYPLLPTRVRQHLAQPAWRVPAWIAPTFARAFDLRDRTLATRLYAGPRGQTVRTALTERLLSEDAVMYREMIGEDNLEWRYPYFDRSLVEYALTLSPEWRFGAGHSKRVLREAMQGLLPESVRLRRGKGGLRPHQPLALRREQRRFVTLFKRSLLAELGCIEPERLLAVITAPQREDRAAHFTIHHTLSLEVWLRQRHDR